MTPPAKFVHDQDGRRGSAVSCLVSGDCIVSGAELRRAELRRAELRRAELRRAELRRSLLFTGVRAHSYSRVERAVVLPQVDIGRGARLTDVVVDRGVRIPPGLVVGEDPALDAQRFRRTKGGICLITQPMIDALGGGR